MAQGLQIELKQFVLSNNSFGPQEIRQIVDAISEDYSQFAVLREAVMELEAREDYAPATAVRLGVCYYLLGRYKLTINTLSNSDGGALAHFYLGKSYATLEQWDQAVAAMKAAAGAGYDGEQCSLAMAEAQRRLSNGEAALALLDDLSGAVEQTAEYLHQRAATIAALGGNPEEVVALLERAVEADPQHPGALFGLALEHDRHGNDETALELYRRAATNFPTHVGSLLNLGVLYEDRQQFDRAQQCYQRILEGYPNHPRANLFYRDAQASGNMYYDEDAQKKQDRLSQVLNIPVTDFELSVRSRNCLQKMGIHALGDLARYSEAELLASKNFGETSLTEISDMLVSKGLSLGQFAHERAEPEVHYDSSSLSADEQALLDRPIADLNLSVRARKCTGRLKLKTIGDLVRRTGDDLLECKNFGVTSLNEVREKLTNFDLKLRGE